MAWTLLSQLGEPSSARKRRDMMEERDLVEFGMFDLGETAKSGRTATELLQNCYRTAGQFA